MLLRTDCLHEDSCTVAVDKLEFDSVAVLLNPIGVVEDACVGPMLDPLIVEACILELNDPSKLVRRLRYNSENGEYCCTVDWLVYLTT